MIRIAINKQARDAIAATLDKGREVADLQELEDGRYWVWLNPGLADALADLRRPGESYSDVILRIARHAQ